MAQQGLRNTIVDARVTAKEMQRRSKHIDGSGGPAMAMM